MPLFLFAFISRYTSILRSIGVLSCLLGSLAALGRKPEITEAIVSAWCQKNTKTGENDEK